ncbi:MAG: alpha-hydroxy-acid oxidizing protein, partial [Candidatus Altiarchaeota archaeon]
PTTESIRQIAPLGKPVIASGGIRTGLDAAKAIALGASCAGMALPVLRVFSKVGAAGVEEYLLRVVDELRIACFLSGAKNPSELSGRALFSLNG